MQNSFENLSRQELVEVQQNMKKVDETLVNLKFAYDHAEELPIEAVKGALGLAIKFLKNGVINAQTLIEIELMTRPNEEAGEQPGKV